MMFLNIAAVVCIGLLIGTEFAVSAFINPVLRKLDRAAQLATIRLFAKRLGSAMPFWYALSFVLLVIESVARHGEPALPLLVGASVVWAAVIVLTLLFLVPINNRLARGDGAAAPEKELQEHSKWDALHRVRVAALAVAMVCLLVATGS